MSIKNTVTELCNFFVQFQTTPQGYVIQHS